MGFFLCLAGLGAGSWCAPPQEAPTPSPAFVENHGQWPAGTRFLLQQAGMRAHCEADGIRLQLSAAAITEVRLEWSTTAMAGKHSGEDRLARAPVGHELLTQRHHFLLGSDPAAWQHDVPAFARVHYRDIRPGVDLVLSQRDGLLSYDLLLAAGSDLQSLQLRCRGIDRLSLDEDGSLVMHTAAGPLRQTPPRTWQLDADGTRLPRTCAFQLLGGDRFAFVVPDADPQRALVIDPGLQWSTYLGGSGLDAPLATALASNGDVLVAGLTESPVFQGQVTAGGDAFVSCYSADGTTLNWTTLVGGSNGDVAQGVAVDQLGAVVLVGWTESMDFPATAGAYDTTYNGVSVDEEDAFVAKLSADGSSLQWATFLGGSQNEEATCVTISPINDVIVGGRTASSDFPGTHGWSYRGGDNDAFVHRFHAAGSSLIMGRLIGGTGVAFGDLREATLAVTVNQNNEAVIVGSTTSADFPVSPNSFDNSYNGSEIDAFAALIDLDDGARHASTFLGGINDEEARAVGLSASDGVFVGGWSDSPDLPTTLGAAFPDYLGGDEDGFLLHLSPTLNSLNAGTFLGGSGDDSLFALAVNDDGAVRLAGLTTSTDLPWTNGAWDTVRNSALGDALVLSVAADLSAVDYASYLGGESFDLATAIALPDATSVVVAGFTQSLRFPLRSGALQSSAGGLGDGFVSLLDLTPGPSLDHGALVRNQVTDFIVSNALPFETVYYLYSLTGTGFGPEVPALGGLGLDLRSLVTLAGQTDADASGQAVFSRVIPSAAPLIPVSTQAVVARGASAALSLKTNTVTRTIQP